MIFETVVNHAQAQPVTEGPHAGKIRFTGYLYADPDEAEQVGRPVGVLRVRLYTYGDEAAE